MNQKERQEYLNRITASDEAFNEWMESAVDEEALDVLLGVMDSGQNAFAAAKEAKTAAFNLRMLSAFHGLEVPIQEQIAYLQLSEEDVKLLSDSRLIWGLLRSGNTMTQVAAQFGCARETVQRRKALAIEKGLWPSYFDESRGSSKV